MGCDIHTVAEYHMDRWIGKVIDYPFRSYEIFGSMCAGIRRYIPDAIPARGLPLDISGTTKDFLEEWTSEAHSYSWLTYEELLTAIERVFGKQSQDNPWPNWIHEEFLDVFDEMPSTVRRLVFWFDN